MRVTDKNIKRAHTTIADRTKKVGGKVKSTSITVYGVTPAQLRARLRRMNEAFFAQRQSFPAQS